MALLGRESNHYFHFHTPNELDRVSSGDKRRVTINILPDDVLLLVFHLDRMIHLDRCRHDDLLHWPWMWDRLVHVCRRWRSVVFASPNFLDLRLVCYPNTPIELIDIWPPLPVTITDDRPWTMHRDYDFDTLFYAAIVHSSRVCRINLLRLSSSKLQRLASAMQKQFPVLTHLELGTFAYGWMAPPALPDRFLDGSAPRLQSLGLNHIPFPALPKLLLSTTDLVRLDLERIPHSGYITPEVIVTGLAVLSNLKSLTIEFHSPRSRPDGENQSPPPPTRIVLPSLTHFQFRGVCEYLEDLVARIDVPLLEFILITFFHQLTIDIPQLAQFMRRTPKFQELDEAHVDFEDFFVQVGYPPPSRGTNDENSGLRISCEKLGWQLSSLAHVFTSFFPSIHMVENLYIYEPPNFSTLWQDNAGNMRLLEVFHPFTAVRNLFVGDKSQSYITRALRVFVWGLMTEVLPSLQNIFLEGLERSLYIQAGVREVIAARRLSRPPITVFLWERGFEWPDSDPDKPGVASESGDN